MMCVVEITREDGSKVEYVLPYDSLWMSKGNFNGFGRFKSLTVKIKQ
jgi:hypothetical protein